MTKLIELTPLSDFFFGGEATFGQDANRHYFVCSNLWPQQTSLLGMLRYEILKSEPLVFDSSQDAITDKTKAAELIGSQGFDGLHEEPFGIIEGLSPVFLLSPDGVPFFLCSQAYLESSTETLLIKGLSSENGFRAINMLDDTTTVSNSGYLLMRRAMAKTSAAPYDGKIEFEETLIGCNGELRPVFVDTQNKNSEGVFIRVFKTGNRKEYDGSTDDSGFFKQDFYKLRSGWRFAVLAELNSELPSSFGNTRLLPLGAERRLFQLKINEPLSEYFKGITFRNNYFAGFEKLYGNENYKAPSGLSQTTLLSDAKAHSDIYNKADFCISKAANFRFLKTNMQDPNTVWTQARAPKSRRYQLLRRGSTFWSNNPQEFETQLQQSVAFRRIGYNYFKTTQSKTI